MHWVGYPLRVRKSFKSYVELIRGGSGSKIMLGCITAVTAQKSPKYVSMVTSDVRVASHLTVLRRRKSCHRTLS